MKNFEKKIRRPEGVCPHGRAKEGCDTCRSASKSGLPHDLREKLTQLAGETKISHEERKDLVASTFDALVAAYERSGGRFTDDVNEVYRKFGDRRDMLVRRDELESITATLTEGKPYEIRFDPAQNGPYDNAALSTASGIRNAFLEGRAHAQGMVGVIGFEKGDLSVQESPAQKRGTIERHEVRQVEGAVPPGDVRYVVLSVPGGLFPEERMSDEEIDRIEDAKEEGKPIPKIFRAFLFEREGDSDKREKAA